LVNRSRFFYGYVQVIVSFLVFMAVIGLATSFVIYFKPIIEELGWSRAATSGAFSINLLFGGLSGILIGLLNDKLGARVVLPACCLASAIAFYFISLMHELWQWYFFFGVVAGIGANVFVPAMSTIARWFTARRSLMSGLAFSGAGFGMLVFPPIINWFFKVSTWRFSLVILSIFLFVIFLLSALFIRRDPQSMGLEPYGAKKAESGEYGKYGKSVLLNKALSTPEFWLFFIALIGYGFCYFSLQVHIAAHATDMGISTGGAAAILAVVGGATIIGQIGLGSIGDKLGNKRTFIMGMIFSLACMLTVIFAREFWGFIIVAALLGLAFGTCSTQESPIVAWLFGLASHGAILGILVFGVTIGASIGPWLFGYIYDLQGSYQLGFYLAAGLAVISIALMLLVNRRAINKFK
jgi:MFS transporter, OFA family, oxalate/formate antiporter